MVDKRDGQEYKTITIKGSIWMAENMNYAVPGSWCWHDDPEYCEESGRLYTWEMVMDGSQKEKARGICPKGWHIPSEKEWLLLAKHKYMQSEDEEYDGLFRNDNGWRRIKPMENGSWYDFADGGMFWSSTIVTKSGATTLVKAVSNSNLKSRTFSSVNAKRAYSCRCVQN